MKKYKCHKVVEAMKIENIMRIRSMEAKHFCISGSLTDGKAVQMELPLTLLDKHNPKLGDYYVKYADGYESFSPAEAFEDGYTLIEE